MSNLTRNQKARRCHDLLLGMSDQRVANALAKYEFTTDDAEEGWTYLRAVSAPAVPVKVEPQVPRKSFTRALSEYQSEWFTLANAVLAADFPNVRDALLGRLVRGETAAGVILDVFLDRIVAMAQGREPFGPEGPAARERLARYGFTAEREAEGRALVEDFSSMEPDPPPDPRLEAMREAEEKLWAWYLKWSTLARRATRDRTLLRSMGFLRRSQKSTDDAGAEACRPGSGQLAYGSVRNGARRGRPGGKRSIEARQAGPCSATGATEGPNG